jgi:DNA-directed RNA polymerase subunit H (RpoH/RPB5)
VLETQLKTHLEKCTTSIDNESPEDVKQHNTKILLSTFLNNFEQKTHQVFFMMEMQSTETITDMVQNFLQEPANEQIRALPFVSATSWDNLLRDLIAQHRHRFTTDFRKQVLATLHISQEDLPWFTGTENVHEKLRKDHKKKRRISKIAEQLKENPQELAKKKLHFKDKFSSAMRQGNWTLLTLVLNTLMKIQKMDVAHVAYACFVMEKLKNGEKLQKDCNSDPAGMTCYYANLILVQQNKCPFEESLTTLEEVWKKVKST